MSGDVQVKPLRSFEHGGAIRTPRRGAFMMPRRIADQLVGMGQVEILKSEADKPAQEPTQPAPEQDRPARARRASTQE